ncbi:MAG: hypothetical protein ABEJ89_05780 [Haloarculaceae archaeon]
MVEDRTTEPRRVAQLLASELTGLERGPLAAVEVVDADPDAEPSPEGPVAYAIAHGGNRVGEVRLYDAGATVELADGDALGDAADGARPSIEGTAPGERGVPIVETEGGAAMRVSSGAAVKRTLDVLVAVLSMRANGA